MERRNLFLKKYYCKKYCTHSCSQCGKLWIDRVNCAKFCQEKGVNLAVWEALNFHVKSEEQKYSQISTLCYSNPQMVVGILFPGSFCKLKSKKEKKREKKIIRFIQTVLNKPKLTFSVKLLKLINEHFSNGIGNATKQP